MIVTTIGATMIIRIVNMLGEPQKKQNATTMQPADRIPKKKKKKRKKVQPADADETDEERASREAKIKSYEKKIARLRRKS